MAFIPSSSTGRIAFAKLVLFLVGTQSAYGCTKPHESPNPKGVPPSLAPAKSTQAKSRVTGSTDPATGEGNFVESWGQYKPESIGAVEPKTSKVKISELERLRRENSAKPEITIPDPNSSMVIFFENELIDRLKFAEVEARRHAAQSIMLVARNPKDRLYNWPHLLSLAIDIYRSLPRGKLTKYTIAEEIDYEAGKDWLYMQLGGTFGEKSYFEMNKRWPLSMQMSSAVAEKDRDKVLYLYCMWYLDKYVELDPPTSPPTLQFQDLNLTNPREYKKFLTWIEKMLPAINNFISPDEAEEWLKMNQK